MTNHYMLRANRRAVSGGISKNPNAMSGPTLNTATLTVRPTSKSKVASHRKTFWPSVTAIARSKETSSNSLLNEANTPKTQEATSLLPFLLFLHLLHQIVVFGHDVVTVFHLVVELFHEIIALGDEVGDARIL